MSTSIWMNESFPVSTSILNERDSFPGDTTSHKNRIKARSMALGLSIQGLSQVFATVDKEEWAIRPPRCDHSSTWAWHVAEISHVFFSLQVPSVG